MDVDFKHGLNPIFGVENIADEVVLRSREGRRLIY